MHLLELLESPTFNRTEASLHHYPVPNWMIGAFRRYSISFANGLTDTETEVYWLQSRRFSIDLRLPRHDQQLPAIPLHAMDQQQRQVLAQHQGWFAESHWQPDIQQLSWHETTSLQVHDLWPEPANLYRVGNCMIEFAPSGILVEDWRLQTTTTGPLVGLKLLGEYNHAGELIRDDGGLIINGNMAAYVRSRTKNQTAITLDLMQRYQHDHHHPATLPYLMTQYGHRPMLLEALMACETSIAQGDLSNDFVVTRSTAPARVGTSLIALDDFTRLTDGKLKQDLKENGQMITRLYAIDALEPAFNYQLNSSAHDQAKDWYTRESSWLERYTKVLS